MTVPEASVTVRPPVKTYWITPLIVFLLLFSCFMMPVIVAWRRGEPIETWVIVLSFLIPAVAALIQLWSLAKEITFLHDGIELRSWLLPPKKARYSDIDGYYTGFTLRMSSHPQSKVLSRGGHAIKIKGKIVRFYALDPHTLEAEFRKRGVPILDAKAFYRARIL